MEINDLVGFCAVVRLRVHLRDGFFYALTRSRPSRALWEMVGKSARFFRLVPSANSFTEPVVLRSKIRRAYAFMRNPNEG
jgi:hypothetical protein